MGFFRFFVSQGCERKECNNKTNQKIGLGGIYMDFEEMQAI